MTVTLRKKESFCCGWAWKPSRYRHYNGAYSRESHWASIQWEETSYEGAVLELGEESVRIMSDVWGTWYYALVWDSETQAPKKVGLQTVDYNLGGTGNHLHDKFNNWYSSATVDATPENLAAYQAWQNEQAEEKTLNEHEANLGEAEQLASEVRKGSFVFLSRKRCKVPYGTKGHVFWTGESRYGERVGFRGEDGETHWTALRNVSVVPGHESWSELCQTCGGNEYGPAGWVPAKDGKGGRKSCPECSRRYKTEAKAEEEAKAAPPAAEVTRGALVEVVKSVGRDAPAGVTGEVFWVGASKFGPGNRVGLKDENGETYWAAEENVRVAA